MPTFTNLPGEIRGLIIKDVLYSERKVDLEPNETGREEIRGLESPESWFAGQHIMYESDPSAYASNGRGLLLVNRQLYREAMDCFRRNGMAAKLDVALRDGNRLYPSWTCIPLPVKRYDTVQVDFRICGPLRAGSAFQGGDGGPPVIVWAFYSLLERFIELGPQPPRDDGLSQLSEGVNAAVLDINFVSPTDVQPDWIRIDRSQPHNPLMIMHALLRNREQRPVLMEAQDLASFLKQHMKKILYPGPWGNQLFESVGALRFRVDGTRFCEWNIGLVQALYRPELHSLLVHHQWKEWCTSVDARRTELGLPIYNLGTWTGDVTERMKQRMRILNGEVWDIDQVFEMMGE